MIHRYRFLCFLALLMLLLGQAALAGGGSDQKPKVLGDVVAAEQAWQLIEDGALLVDVRSAREFESGSIEGAINIPHSEVDELAALIGDDLERPVVFFCRSGGRAGRVQATLEGRGYSGIFNGTGLEALLATKP